MDIPKSIRWPWWVGLIGRIFTGLLGWRIEGEFPPYKKFVVVVAPHTSYWDFPIWLGMAFTLRLYGRYFAKKEVFDWPIGFLFRWTGGIPVDRQKHNNMVEVGVDILNRHDAMVFGVAPEGTRAVRDHWKTGFYHIALQAGVPIILTYADYARKVGGWGPVIHPSGDIEADMAIIREFYAGVTPRNPELRTIPRVKSDAALATREDAEPGRRRESA